MADSGGMRLGLMLAVGFLLIETGITGRLGSLLGAVIDPNAMREVSGGSSSSGLINSGSLPTTGTLSAKQIGEYAILAGFPAKSIQTAIAVALAESGGRVKAENYNSNGSTDYGVWQINSSIRGYDPKLLLTPAYNAQAAYTISSSGTNWQPWTTYQTGAYLRFMDQALQGAQEAALANVGIGG